MAGIGVRGLLLNLSLHLALFIGLTLSALPFAFAFPEPALLPRFTWLVGLAGGIGAFAVAFQTGRWIARRARDRELAACVAFLIIQAIVMPVIGETLFGGRWIAELAKGRPDLTPAPHTTSASIALTSLMSIIAFLAGAISVRRRFVNGATS